MLFLEIPSPTHKTSSISSQHEDCVVPDIDNDEDVFNFDKPNFPTGMFNLCMQTFSNVVSSSSEYFVLVKFIGSQNE